MQVRKLILLPILVLLLFSLAFCVYAHPGGTDENGGHIDKDTGKYHYHHGYPSHDHYDIDDDGDLDCPYIFDDQTRNHKIDNNEDKQDVRTNMNFMNILGILLLIFVVTALVNYYGIYLDEQKGNNLLSKIISVITTVGYFLSAPVMVVLYPIYKLYTNRAIRCDRDEQGEMYDKLSQIDKRHIDELKKENDFLKDENQKLRQTKFLDIYNNGYRKGYDKGIEEGYSIGYNDCSEGHDFDADYISEDNR